jgi:hypothetical protein
LTYPTARCSIRPFAFLAPAASPTAERAAYRRYRESVATDPEGIAANRHFATPPFQSYRRCFLEPMGE